MAATLCLCLARTPAVRYGCATIMGHHVKYLVVRLDRVRIETALGRDRVARMESLAQMAMRHHALAAIDGGFFEAGYPGPFKGLIGTTTVNGQIVFKGDIGSTLYFDAENVPSIQELSLRIEGAIDGSYTYPNDWDARWINHYPETPRAAITIFTPAWGGVTGLRGFQVQVEGGVVTDVSRDSLPIPPDGYVIYFRGVPVVASRFRVGRRIEYRVVRKDGDPLGTFADALQAIGGGPRLIVDGRIALDPHSEGFHDPQLFRNVARSVVGVTRDRHRLILATATGSLHQMARIMQALGAYQAMNLDGGASSGLWARGHYLTRPHRLLTNALLVLPLAR